MGVQIPIGFAEVTQEFLLAGKVEPMVCVTGHEVPDGETAIGLATIVRNEWEESWGWPTGQPSVWTLGKATCRIRVSSTVVEVGEDPSTTTGDGASADSMPINCALLVKKITGLAGRKFRGRMYVPGFGVPDSAVSIDGTLSGATRNGAQNAVNAWQASLVLQGAGPYLFHSDDTPPTPITILSVESRIATQRRRLR